MSDKNFEIIVGVDQRVLFPKDSASDFFPCNGEHFVFEQIGKMIRFAYRGVCETDPSFKQIIPYCLITKGEEIFGYRRSGEGDSRLTGKFSIGIGGHMNPIPVADFMQMMEENMLRELNEEVEIILPDGKELEYGIVGIISTSYDEVSAVHTGVVYNISLPVDAVVNVRETDKITGCWGTPEFFIDSSAGLELWSEICLEDYFFTRKEQAI